MSSPRYQYMSLVVRRASGVLGSGLYTSTPPRCLFVRPRGLLDHQLEVNDPEAVLPVVFDVPGPRSALYVDDYARWKQVMYDILLNVLYIYIEAQSLFKWLTTTTIRADSRLSDVGYEY